MTLTKKIVMGITALVVVILAAYAFEYTYKAVGTKSGTIVEIAENNQPAAYMGSDVLKQLPGGTNENPEEGPTLNAVLLAAGITDFVSAEIWGARNDTPYLINEDEISDDFIFYYTSHNTVNLVKKDRQQVLMENVSGINVQS